MKFYNKHEADRYGLAEEAIGDMIAACSNAIYHEMLTKEEQEIVKNRMQAFHLEQTKLNINDLKGVESVIEKYCPLLKNDLVSVDYLIYGKTTVHKSAR
jgi:DNA-binding protein H-NS